jgi:acetyl esterase
MMARVESAIATSLLRLPHAMQARLLGGRRVIVDGLTLDMPTQLLLKLMSLNGFPATEDLTVAEARALYRERAHVLGPPRRAMHEVVDRLIDGPRGPIPVRVYRASANIDPLPVLVYYHGGGWVIGDLETHDGVCRQLAVDVGCIIVAVDYRRAPEHKFPAAADDAVAAFRWVAEHAAELGGDAARIAVAGDSAGGNLAAVVAQGARDSGGPQPCYQVLIYPVTDLRAESRSYETFADGFILTRDLMHWFRAHYLSSEKERTDPRASPLLASDLSRLPPAFIMTAGFDPLRDEGRAYAERLREAGNSVTYRCYDGLIHGFISFTGGVVAARHAVGHAADALRRAFSAGSRSSAREPSIASSPGIA